MLLASVRWLKKLNLQVKARKDKNFLIIARTDANAVEGLDKTISRSKSLR
jgi:methylisocitrate lyase